MNLSFVLLILVPIVVHSQYVGPILGLWATPTKINSTGNCFFDSIPALYITPFQEESDSVMVGFEVSDNLWSLFYNNEFFSINSTDPLVWQISDESDPTTTISYLSPLDVPNGPLNVTFINSTSNCSYSYQKNTTFLSGTWNFDAINDQSLKASLPESLTISNFGDVYMNISVTYSNSTTYSGYFYFTPNGTYQGIDITSNINYGQLGIWNYNSSTNTFFSAQSPTVAYTSNGSYFTAYPYIGSWSDPQDASDDVRTQCCVPYSVQILGSDSNSNSNSNGSKLSVELFFNETILDLSDCSFLTLYEEGDSVPLTFHDSLDFFTGFSYSYDNSDFGTYSFALASPTELSLKFGRQCTFTMSQSSPNPNPKSSNLLESKIICLIFVLVSICLGI